MILYLSWSTPDQTSGSGVIINNLARGFRKEEFIIYGEEPIYKQVVEWGEDLPRFHYIIKTPVWGKRFFTVWRLIYFPIAFVKILFVIWKKKVKKIVVVYPDEVFLLLGYLAATVNTVDFFCYFHNTYYENRVGIQKIAAKRFQEMVFSKAKYIFSMSEGLNEYYKLKYQKHSEKFVSIQHSYFNSSKFQIETPKRGLTLKKTFLFSGSINSSNLIASISLFEAILLESNNNIIRILTPTPSKVFLTELLANNIGRIQIDQVTREVLIGEMPNADFLLLPHGFNSSFSEIENLTIFPTKCIEYFYSNRPIIALVPANSFISNFLIKNNCAYISNKIDKEHLINFITNCKNDYWDSSSNENVKKYFDYNLVSKRFYNFIK
jgi:hypothetical protein